MSLDSQHEEVERLIESNPDITVVDTYQEAFSAKMPGRALFNEMLERIESGEAEGIIAWHPDRLARNSMDGGRIIYLLDQGALKDLRFCSYSFENSSQGKFMLAIVFGYSKYYVDNLSENVRRGLRTKVRNGWLPNQAPIGYRNCKDTGTIVPDGEHFVAVQRMFGLLLSGQHSISGIHRIICDEWGYITPIRKTRGGKKLGRTALYRLLSNPFYAGFLPWRGRLHEGNHTPVVSPVEFERVQALLHRSHQPRPRRKSFAYGGVFTCGACGLRVTAEHKRKPSGRRYTYYHCTRVHRTPRCLEPSIEERELDGQAGAFVDRVALPDSIRDWFAKEITVSTQALSDARDDNRKRFEKQVEQKEQQLSNLTDLRIRDILTDEEFNKKHTILTRELAAAKTHAQNAEKHAITFEPVHILNILRNKAVIWFDGADHATKQAILKILCSNPTIRGKKALLFAKKPFVEIDEIAVCRNLRGGRNETRKGSAGAKSAHKRKAQGDTRRHNPEFTRRLSKLASDPETIALAEEARELIERIDPLALAQLDALSEASQRTGSRRCRSPITSPRQHGHLQSKSARQIPPP